MVSKHTRLQYESNVFPACKEWKSPLKYWLFMLWTHLVDKQFREEVLMCLIPLMKLQGGGVDEAHISKRDRPVGYTTYYSWVSSK
jgi:hypothetical protein